MNKITPQELRELKERFRALSGKDREQLSVSFLKVKLGVNSDSEIKLVKAFIGSSHIEINAEHLDHLITYLHSELSSLPEFFAMEDSLDEEVTEKTFKPILPHYNADEVDTLKDGKKPFGSV